MAVVIKIKQTLERIYKQIVKINDLKSEKLDHDLEKNQIQIFLLKHKRRQWHPTPVLLPGKSHGQRSLVGCSPWGHEESDTTERLIWSDLILKKWASLVAQRLKHLPSMWEIWILSLGWEDPLEKAMATHSSILAWKIPWTEEPGGLQSMGLQRVGHDWSNLAAAAAAVFRCTKLK